MMQEEPPRIKDIRVNHTDVIVSFEVEFTDEFNFRTVTSFYFMLQQSITFYEIYWDFIRDVDGNKNVLTG